MTTVFDRFAALSGSLKWRVTLGTVASLVLGIGLCTLVLLKRAEHDTLQDHTRHELSEAVRTASLLARNVVDLQRALRVVAGQLDAATLADDTALSRFLEDKLVLRSLFSNVFVASPQGRMMVFADEKGVRSLDFNLSDRAYFQRTLKEARPIVSDPVPGRLTGAPVVILTQPLRGERGVYAVMGGGLRLSSSDLLANLVDAQDADEEALIVVTDARGTVLAHPDRARLLRPLSEEPRLAGAFAAWVAGGSAVEPAGLQLAQTGAVVSAAGVPGPDWMVWRARSETDVLAPLRAARTEALGWAGALIALTSLGTLLLLTWLLRPLGQLATRAQHLFDGVLPAEQGWPSASGEIGRLAQVLKQVGIDRLQLETANSELLKLLGSVMASSPIGIAFTRNRRFELVSTEFCRLFQRKEAELLGSDPALIYDSIEDYARLGPQVVRAFKAGQPYVGEWQMVRADGSRFWVQLRGSPVDGANAAAGTIWTLTDISDQKVAHEELEWTARHDPLTGLANRREFEQRAAALVESLPGSLPAAVVFIDLDHFKPVNDQGGHAAGDAMLVAVAQAITSAVRTTDLVARLGGDEFALLLQRCSPRAALRIAESVRTAVAGIALSWEGQTFTVGASLGVAHLEADMATVGAWLAVADSACYAAKSAGRGVVRGAEQDGWLSAADSEIAGL